ncbi:hypothetical protein IWQ60_004876 [Tieghemiomyces parasiticus]|uniref:Uncharacterized protein n=1 Tax=Tieghemiomyces parasiticus TaxID=78921 RepID=A0A9W8DV40_9FUNG|nr:hypothetical protein IWQ60_004876 [Tieghemiomyces parasiticus]
MDSVRHLTEARGAAPTPEVLATRRRLLHDMQRTSHLLDTCFTIPVPFPLSLAVRPFSHWFHNLLALLGLVTRSVMGKAQPATNGPAPAGSGRQFKGTEVKVGLQALIGLVPVLGAAAGFILSLYPVALAYRIGTPKHLLVWMMLTRLVDLALGVIPVVGDLLGAMFKINAWSYLVVERWVEKEERRARQPANRASKTPSMETTDSFLATPSERWFAGNSSSDEGDNNDNGPKVAEGKPPRGPHPDDGLQVRDSVTPPPPVPSNNRAGRRDWQD